MSEFALGPTGHNAHFGPCRNPHARERVSGGSSSGSASAVASGMIFAALGSDTAGSVRLPASMCGVVGLKPTLSRVSCYGTMPLSASLDTIGVLARRVADCAYVFDAIAGPDPKDPDCSNMAFGSCAAALSRVTISGLRLGKPATYYLDGLDDAVAGVFETAFESLLAQGANGVEIVIPHHDPIAEAATIIITSEAAALHASWLETRPNEYSRSVRERIETGFTHDGPTYLNLLSDRSRRVGLISEHVFGLCDVLVTPVLDVTTPTVEETDIKGGPASLALISELNRKTRTVNYLGFPALAVPAGVDHNDMPVSIQFIGPPFSECLLFRVAAAFEQAVAFNIQPKLGLQ